MLHVTACQPWPQLAESAKVSFLVCGHHLELPFLCVPDGRVPPGSAPTTHADRGEKCSSWGPGSAGCCPAAACFPFGGDWHRDAWSTAPTAVAGNGQFPQTYMGAELTGFVSPHLSFVIWNSTDFFCPSELAGCISDLSFLYCTLALKLYWYWQRTLLCVS